VPVVVELCPCCPSAIPIVVELWPCCPPAVQCTCSYIRWDPWQKLVDCHSTTIYRSASWSSQWSGRQGNTPLSRQSDCLSAGPLIHIRILHLNASHLSTGRRLCRTPIQPLPPSPEEDTGTRGHTWGPTSQMDGAHCLPDGEPDIRDHGRWRCNQVVGYR
jgi:hypothetical protein